MRTRTTFGVLLCVIGVIGIVREAGARRPPQQDAPAVVTSADCEHLPPNISVSPDLQEIVERMLRDSATFRRQCRLVRSLPHLRVRIIVEVQPALERLFRRARCDMTRYELGAMTALVRVGSYNDAIELIAHELEHVLEFAEGLDYRALAMLQPDAAWADREAFETVRATRVGKDVERELRLARLIQLPERERSAARSASNRN